jgi:phage FluMu gp28-like protein
MSGGMDGAANPLLAGPPADPADDLPPPVLLPYQQAWIADDAPLKIWEKSRRIGATWGESADDVLIAAREDRPSNVMYISATQDMAREYIEAVAMWARAMHYAASQIGEGIYDDGEGRAIKTFEVNFPATGRRVVALSSRPTNLRGKQGVVVIDEAAFHGDLQAMLKAALAMLLWGDQVRIISTHDGIENAFNQLSQEVRAGKRGTQARVHRTTFREAVQQGLYRRVCLRRGIEWTQAGEDAWVEAAYAFYGDAASEELDVVPSQSAGAYLSLALIEQRMTSVPPPDGPALLRGKWDDAFAYLPEDVRRQAIDAWCREQLLPHLERLRKDRRHAFGQDFARNRDQSVIAVLEEDLGIAHRVRLVVELANCPFSSQQRILEFIVDRLPGFRGGAMDATGNGAALAEAAAQKYGVEMVEQVKLSDQFYLAHMPKLRAELQDGTLQDIPRDSELRDDLRAVKLVQGIPKVPRGATQSASARAAAAEAGAKVQRHGDFAIALFLAVYAFYRQVGEVAWTPAPRDRDLVDGEDGWGDFGNDDDSFGFAGRKGAY